MKSVTILLLPLLFGIGCKQSQDERVIARAFDKNLYYSELKKAIPKDVSRRDSTEIANNYIENWIRQNVILHQAEQNVEIDQSYIDMQLEAYRNSLVIYSYEQELTRQKLDTIITDEQVKKYYNEHKGDFQLRKSIFKIAYIKLKKKAPQVNVLKKWIISDDVNDQQALVEYCNKFAQESLLGDTSWHFFEEISSRLPLNNYDEQSLPADRVLELKGDEGTALLLVTEMRMKDSLSPIDMEEDNIKNLIINRRKINLLQSMEKDVYEKAQANNDIEIYTK